MQDGTHITVPDDTAETEMNAIFDKHERQQTARASREAFDSGSPLEHFGVGVAKPFVQLGLGVKDLISRLSPEDREALTRLQQTHGVAAGAGQVVGNIAALAAPGAGAARLARAASLLPRALARFAPAVLDAGANASVEALKAPEAGGSRLQNAATGAVGSAVGSAAAPVLRAAVLGLRPGSTQAAQFLEAGVPLTPGMLKGGVTKTLEEKLSNVPFIGAGIRAREADARAAWNRNLLNDVVPEGEVTAAGHEGFKQAKGAFRSAYDTLWAHDIPADTNAITQGWARIAGDMPQGAQAADVAGRLAKLHNDYVSIPTESGSLPGSAISKLDDELRTLASKAGRRGDSDAAAAFSKARGQMRAALPEPVSQELARIDGLYRQYAVARRAGSYVGSADQGGTFTPRQLLQAAVASDKTAGKDAVARGVATLQPEATEAAGVLGSGKSVNWMDRMVGASALGGAVYANPKVLPVVLAGRAAYTRPGVAWLTGQTGWQRAIKPSAQELLKALRNYVGPGQVGTAVADENQ